MTSYSLPPTAPNANCKFCGKPVIWVKKSPEELQRAAEENADISEFHRPLDATKVSAGYTIINGSAYYVYVHDMHVCEVAPVSREAVASKNAAAAAFFQSQIAQKDIHDKNLETYGDIRKINRQLIRSVINEKTQEFEWDFALERQCSVCHARVDQKCTSMNKGARFGNVLLHPHDARITRDEYSQIASKLADWHRSHDL